MNIEEIDRQIGMPDIDQEWAKFEREVIDTPRIAPRSKTWMSRAAAIAILCTIGFVALASTIIVYNMTPKVIESTPEVNVGSTENVTTETMASSIDITSYENEERQEWVFDNVEMQSIALCLQKQYGVDPVFVTEEAKHIRLYVTIAKNKKLPEVIAFLNNLQVVQLRLEGNKLVIE